MSSYLSSILSTTSSRYNSLRRTLLSDEADGDTEDDTHICRVLRAYYTEKGRPFPPWLPPDPKAPQRYPAAVKSTRSSGGTQRGSGAGGLSDLWESPQQASAEENMSLRRGGQGRAPAKDALQRPGPSDVYNSRLLDQQSGPTGRPLPSQRVGSYQNQLAQQQSLRSESNASPAPSTSSGTSAQERLKARLWGAARAASPKSCGNPESPTAVESGPPSPYAAGGGYSAYSPSATAGSTNSGAGNPYDRGYGGRGGGAGDGRGPQNRDLPSTPRWAAGNSGRLGQPGGPRQR